MFRCPQPSIVKNNYYFQNNAKGKQLLWRHYQLTYFFHTPHIDVVLPPVSSYLKPFPETPA